LSGSVTAWFRAVSGRHVDQLETDGDRLLVGAILDGLHGSLARPVAA
jgi:hypothetical protein